jgi:hypothetical protein
MNNSYEREVIIISFYTHIIDNILQEHQKLSVPKIIVFAFLLKKYKVSTKVYDSKNKNDVMMKFLSQLSGQYTNFIKDLEFLFKSIDILVKQNKIEYKNNSLLKIKDIEIINNNNNNNNNNNTTSDFIHKAINESKNYSDEQFMKEVLYYV